MTDTTPEPRARPVGRDQVLQVLDRFETGMLVTLSPEGVMRSRPMFLADHDDDGTLWFLTGSHSGKVDEVAMFERASVIFQAPRLYLHLSGEAHVVDDRPRLRGLWRESWRAWFPNGPDDEGLVLLRVDPKSADLWDMRGAGMLRQLLHAARTWVRGESAEQAAIFQHQHTAL